jgi:hypothetical protein
LSDKPNKTNEREVANKDNPKLPPGLVLIKDFLTSEQEQSLLHELAGTEHAWQVLSKRKVQHYGASVRRTLMF